MTPDTSRTASEPVAALGAIPILVTAVLSLAVAFGVSLDDAQTAAVLGVTSAVIAVVTAMQRNKVYPAGKVEGIMDAESVISEAANR
jgi:spore maturation protein SpmB